MNKYILALMFLISTQKIESVKIPTRFLPDYKLEEYKEMVVKEKFSQVREEGTYADLLDETDPSIFCLDLKVKILFLASKGYDISFCWGRFHDIRRKNEVHVEISTIKTQADSFANYRMGFDTKDYNYASAVPSSKKDLMDYFIKMAEIQVIQSPTQGATARLFTQKTSQGFIGYMKFINEG